MAEEIREIVNEETGNEAGKKKKIPFRKTWKRWAAIAAALIFLLAGTAMTRDTLAPRKTASTASGSVYTAGNGMGAVRGSYMSALDAPAESGVVYTEPAVYEEALYDADSSADYDARYGSDDTVKSNQMIIRTVSMTLGTYTFEETYTNLRNACEQAGGWIEQASENTNYGLRRVSMTLRIPADRLDEYTAAIASEGRVISRSESATDVTESYQDTQTRLATQRALMDRLQSLVGTAASLTELLQLESQIADTQYTIDRLQGSLNSTERKVNYATVEISLREETDEDTSANKELTLGERIAAGARQGWEDFSDFMEDLLVFVVSALPLLITVAVIVTVITLIVKKTGKKRGK